MKNLKMIGKMIGKMIVDHNLIEIFHKVIVIRSGITFFQVIDDLIGDHQNSDRP